jgi:hypothetical protein
LVNVASDCGRFLRFLQNTINRGRSHIPAATPTIMRITERYKSIMVTVRRN